MSTVFDEIYYERVFTEDRSELENVHFKQFVNSDVAGARTREMAIPAYLPKCGNHNNQYQPQYRRVQTPTRLCQCIVHMSFNRQHY